jgi:hypothetical protein
MKRFLIVLMILAGMAGLGVLLVWQYHAAERTTLTRLSPDETRRAILVEREHQFVDRNFQIRLESLADGGTTILFRSPDEGGPYGTERLIWSKDGTKLLLVGRHFFVREDLFLDNGDQLYFLYDLPSGKAWSNSEQSLLPPLKAVQVKGVEFTEPVVLKEK